MTVRAYNKVTKTWTSTETGAELSPADQWIVNPMFLPDEGTCFRHGQEFWFFPPNSNVIQTVSEEVYQATMLKRAQEQKWREIQAERDRRKYNGAKVGNLWFHTDDSSRILYLGLLLMGNNIPPNLMWKTMSGDFTPMTPALAQKIFQAIAALDITLFNLAEQKRAEMMRLDNPYEYNALAGWPPTFKE